jgi:hypothetical protein
MSSNHDYSPNGRNSAAEFGKPDMETADIVTTNSSMSPPDFVQKWSQDERDHFESQLRRKIDFRLLPMVILMYILNYLDRNNIASARIAGPNGKGIQDELGLSSTQYQVRRPKITVNYF